MLVAIGVVSGISVFQEARSEKALKALRKLLQPFAGVVRNGVLKSIDATEVVPGDVLVLEEGEQVVADGTLLEANDFSVNEAVLTGESFPVLKTEQGCPVFAGTTVVSGRGFILVTATSGATKMGQLGISLGAIEKEPTVLQRQVKRFVQLMASFGLVAFMIVFLVHFLKSGEFLHSLLHGLTLAMAAIPEEIPFAFTSFMALGAFHLLQKKVLTRQPQTVESLGSATVICVDKTGTLTRNTMEVSDVYVLAHDQLFHTPAFNDPQVKMLLQTALLASELAPFDPMEHAIHDACSKQQLSHAGYTMIHEYPLGGVFPFMTHIYAHEVHGTLITAKGAPEGLLSSCIQSEAERKRLLSMTHQLAADGKRVLAVGTTSYNGDVFPKNQDAFNWNIIGLIAFSDPPRENIQSVLDAFYRAGVEVKMITGDFPVTAMAIARAAGIRNADQVLTGEVIEKMNGAQLQEAVKKVNVFARTMPETKLRIVRALKNSGEIVAMTGDGVNDAPALKAAHIGIAMGHRGSEVARQAASLVLVEDDLKGMVDAIELGRTIFENLKKAFRYLITIHIPLILVVLLPLLFGWDTGDLFTPVHVIFLELVMGPTCSIVFEREPAEPGIMLKKPRKAEARLFSFRELLSGIIQGLVITAVLLGYLYVGMKNHDSEAARRTSVFFVLVMCNVFLTISARSTRYTILTTMQYRNNLMIGVLGVTVVVLLSLIFVPAFASLFGFVQLPPVDLIKGVLIAFVAVGWMEIVKWVRLHR